MGRTTAGLLRAALLAFQCHMAPTRVSAQVGLGRIVALYCRSSTLHRNRYYIR